MQPHESELVYAAVAARRLQWDNLLWQVPTLSLTAQAFLFTIALGTDSQRFARTVACALSLIVTFLCITVGRYRQAEIGDADWLEQYESDHGLPAAHGKEFKKQRDGAPLAAGWIGRLIPVLPGFKTWTIGLSLFGFAALTVLVLTWLVPSVFIGSSSPCLTSWSCYRTKP